MSEEAVVAKSGRFLMIDDCLFFQSLVSATLALDGWQVDAVGSGAEGLFEARARQPDMILLDINLPDMSGFEVFALLKAGAETQHIPVLFMTGSTEEGEEARAREMGATDFLSKPVSMKELRAHVQGVSQACLEGQLAPTSDDIQSIPSGTRPGGGAGTG